MKTEKRLLTITGVCFAAFAGVWYYCLMLYRELMDCFIEQASLRADPTEASGLYEGLCGRLQWNLAWTIGYGAPLVSVLVLLAFVRRRRPENGWIAVLAIHFLAFLCLALLHMTTFAHSTWAVWCPKPRVIATFPMAPWSPITDISSQLDASAGKWVTLSGFADQRDGHACLSVPEGQTKVSILVRDKTEWDGAPSHRSRMLIVKGLLTKEKSGYILSHTEHEWGDR